MRPRVNTSRCAFNRNVMNMATIVKTVLVQFLSFSRKVEFEVPSGMDGITEREVLIEEIKVVIRKELQEKTKLRYKSKTKSGVVYL